MHILQRFAAYVFFFFAQTYTLSDRIHILVYMKALIFILNLFRLVWVGEVLTKAWMYCSLFHFACLLHQIQPWTASYLTCDSRLFRTDHNRRVNLLSLPIHKYCWAAQSLPIHYRPSQEVLSLCAPFVNLPQKRSFLKVGKKKQKKKTAHVLCAPLPKSPSYCTLFATVFFILPLLQIGSSVENVVSIRGMCPFTVHSWHTFWVCAESIDHS